MWVRLPRPAIERVKCRICQSALSLSPPHAAATDPCCYSKPQSHPYVRPHIAAASRSPATTLQFHPALDPIPASHRPSRCRKRFRIQPCARSVQCRCPKPLRPPSPDRLPSRSEEHTSELQSLRHL